MFNDYLKLIRRLPLALNLAWLLMHVGLALMILSFEHPTGRVGLIGLGLLVAGFLLVGLDGFFRKGDRRGTALFGTKLFVSMLAAVFMATVGGCVLIVCMLVLAIFGEFEWMLALRTVHFFGLVILFYMVVWIPSAAKSVEDPEVFEKEDEV